MERLDNTICLLTGVATGIGRNVMETLLTEIDATEYQTKPEVVGVDIRKIDFSHTLLTKLEVDLSKPEQILNMFQEIKAKFPDKKISILFCNAARARAVPLLADSRLNTICEFNRSFENAYSAFNDMVQLNVIGTALVIRKAIEDFMDHEFPGYIINTCSMSGHRQTVGIETHFYSATKHGVTAITEGVRQELRVLKSHIRIGQICPGYVDTNFFVNQNVDNPKFMEKIEKYAVPGALLPEDVSAVVMMMIKSHPRCQYGDVLMRPTLQHA